jgi:hypothetical protein
MTVENRLAKLERRCRVLTIALAAAMLLPAVALLAGAGQLPNEAPLRLRQLEIVDANGTARMRLGPLNDEFGLFMRDPTGQPLVTLSDSPEATMFSISKDGSGIRLLANRQGSDITLRDSKNNVRAVTTATQAGGQIEIRGANGEGFSVPPAGE